MARDEFSRIEGELAQAESSRTRLFALAGAAALLTGISVILWFKPGPPPLVEDHAARVAHIAPFVELGSFAGGWVGTVDPGWIGISDASIAAATCRRLAQQLDVRPPDTVQILAPEGLDIVECSAE